MKPAELGRIATVFRDACEPVGRYQPVRIAGAKLAGWTATSTLVRTRTLEFDGWLASLGLDRLDLTGRSVLDVGCCTGSVGFEVARLGADRVLGIDSSARVVGYATVWRALMALDEVWPIAGSLEFQTTDAASDGPGVDVVLCLSVLHHIRRPRETLRRLADRAREVLAIEVQTPSPDVACVVLDSWADEVHSKPQGETYGHGHFPTLDCVRESLFGLGFQRVVHVGPGRVPGREVLHAHR